MSYGDSWVEWLCICLVLTGCHCIAWNGLADGAGLHTSAANAYPTKLVGGGMISQQQLAV